MYNIEEIIYIYLLLFTTISKVRVTAFWIRAIDVASLDLHKNLTERSAGHLLHF